MTSELTRTHSSRKIHPPNSVKIGVRKKFIALTSEWTDFIISCGDLLTDVDDAMLYGELFVFTFVLYCCFLARISSRLKSSAGCIILIDDVPDCVVDEDAIGR
jgi:hypothetical protein